MKWSVEKKVVAGVGIALVVLLVNELISYRATRSLIDQQHWIAHTHMVLEELERTLSSVKDAETGVRGYYITGDESHLEGYYAALADIPAHLERLNQLTADNPEQNARVPILQARIAERMDRLKIGLDQRRNGPDVAGQSGAVSSVGKRLMDSLREYIDTMEADEEDLLKSRYDQSKASGNYAFITDVIPNSFACALLLLVSYVIIRDIRERKRAEEALRLQREWLQVTLSSIGDAVIATDTSGSVSFMNDVAQSLTGWDRQRAQGQPLEKVFAIVNEDTREQVENPALRAMKQGAIVSLSNHTVLIGVDGTETPIDDSGAPIRDSEGNILGAVLVFRDVTERRSADHARSALVSIVESSQDAIISKDLSGTILSWNAGAERMFGYTAAEIVGQSINTIIPPERRAEEEMIVEQCCRGERIGHFETVRLSKSGELVDISLTISPLRNSNGRVTGVSKIARDIGERKRSQQELFESRERLRMAMQAGQMGTWTRQLDESNRVHWSAELEEIFGFEAGAFPETEEAFFELLHPDDRERLREAVGNAIKSGTDYEAEFRYTRKGEGLRWMMGRGRAFYDSEGRPFRLAGLGWDITEHKRAEEALRQQREWWDPLESTCRHASLSIL